MSTAMSTQTNDKAGSARRVLVVADVGLCDRLKTFAQRHVYAADVAFVPGYLAALGHEGSAGPGRGVDVIVGPVGAMAGMETSTLRALRELSPGARVVLLAGDEEADATALALAAGADEVWPQGLEEDHLVALLGQEHAAGTSGRAEADERPNAVADAPPIAEMMGQAMRSAVSSPEPKHDGMIGDVDLVEAVLSGGGRVRGMSLGVIESQSGLQGVGWVQREDEVPGEHAREAVCFGGRDMGWLHAVAGSPDSADGLRSWAAWLARWLALDDQMAQMRTLAMRDELTGAWNRRYFNRFLDRVLERAAHDRTQVTLLVFDIDDFKIYNDRYGHPAGDDILKEAAKLMQAAVREHDVVARIGGDEFAVIFWEAGEPRGGANGKHPDDVMQAARRFQRAIYTKKFPKLLNEAPGTLTISGGLATYPWDGRTPEELLDAADQMALKSKQQGKNAITFGPGAMEMCKVDANGNGK